jgi:hypothetical protein
MKWEDIRDQFFQSAERLSGNVDYITQVGEAFEALIKVLYQKDPGTCIDDINKDAEIVGKIFTVEDPQSIPPEAIKTSSEALVRTQQFLFTFLRVSALFSSTTNAYVADMKIPPGSKIH